MDHFFGSSPGGRSVVLGAIDDLDVDFGFAPAGSIGDLAYVDEDQNEHYDPGEDVLSNIQIDLYDGDCPADLLNLTTPIRTTFTDVSGLYLFDEVPDGDYCVVAVNPDGGEPTEGAYGQEIEVQGGTELRADFGFAPTGTIGDFVYWDANTDRNVDVIEEGREGVTLALHAGGFCPADLLTLGVPYRVTSSDENGLYLFDQVPSGEYCVVAMDGNVDTLLQGEFGQSVTVTDTDVTDADFGYVPRASIGTHTYSDNDGSELQDVGEAGLFGVPVQLWSGLCDAPDNVLLDITISSIGGVYSFDDLPAGEYCLRSVPDLALGELTQGLGGHSVTLFGIDMPDADFGIQRSTDLSLNKAVSDATETPVPVGTEATFELRILNESDMVTATEVELTDFLPVGFTFVSASDGGVHDGSVVGGNVVWVIDTITPRTTATVTVTVLVNDTDALFAYRNLAEITSMRQPDSDSLTDNHSVNPDEDDSDLETLSTTPVSDLELTKTALTPTPLLTDEATFELVIVNVGPSATSNVTVSDILPNGLVFQSASETLYPTATPGEYIWDVGDLDVGETRSVTIVADVLTSYTETLNYLNVAEVATSDSDDPDSRPGNMLEPAEDDEAQAQLYPVGITIGKDLVSFEPAASGNEDSYDVTFELQVYNPGIVELLNLNIEDDVVAQFGEAFVETISMDLLVPAQKPVTVGDALNDPFLLNPGFLGTAPEINIVHPLDAIGLASQDGFELQFVVEIRPDLTPDTDSDGVPGPLENLAYAQGDVNPDGLPAGAPEFVEDWSDSGRDTGKNAGSPNNNPFPEPVGSPTGVPAIALTKTLLNSSQPAIVDGEEQPNTISLTLEYSIDNVGGLPLSNMQFREDLLNTADQVTAILDEGMIDIQMPVPSQWTADNLDDGFASVPDFREFLGGDSTLLPGESLVFRLTMVAAIDPALAGDFVNTATVLAYADIDEDGTPETEFTDSSDNGGTTDGTPGGNPSPLPSVMVTKSSLDDVRLIDASTNMYRSSWGIEITNTGAIDLVDLAILDDFAGLNDVVIDVDAMSIAYIDDSNAGALWAVPAINFLHDDWVVTPLSLDFVPFGDGLGNALEPGDSLYFEVNVDFTTDELDSSSQVMNIVEVRGYGDADSDGFADDRDSDGNADLVAKDDSLLVDGSGGEPVGGVEPGDFTVEKTLVEIIGDSTGGDIAMAFEIEVENTGGVALTDFSIIEDMTTELGMNDLGGYVFLGLVGAPEILRIEPDSIYNQVFLDPAFDGGLDAFGTFSGNTEMLLPDTQLEPGGSFVLSLTAAINMEISFDGTTFGNQVQVSGYVDQDEDGEPDDGNNDGEIDPPVSRPSDNGNGDGDDDNDGDPLNDRTPLPALEVTKDLVEIETPYDSDVPADPTDTEIRMVFDIQIANTGATRLHNVRLHDRFLDQPIVDEIKSVRLISLTPSNPVLWEADVLPETFMTDANGAYFTDENGSEHGVATLDPGDFVDVQFELIAALDIQADASFINSAVVCVDVDLNGDGDGLDAGDGSLCDVSDGDGDPLIDDPTDTGTNPGDDPVQLPLIATSKDLSDALVTEISSRQYEVKFEYEIYNLGGVDLVDVQFFDDFMAQNNGDLQRIESIDLVEVSALDYFPHDDTYAPFRATTLDPAFMLGDPAEMTLFTDGNAILAPGDILSFSARVQFTMVEDFLHLETGSTITNQSRAQGTSAENPAHVVEAVSGQGLGANVTTTVGIPAVRLEKTLTKVQTSEGEDHTLLTFEFALHNEGTEPLADLSLIEDLETQMGGLFPDGGFVGLSQAPQWLYERDLHLRNPFDDYTLVEFNPSFDGTVANSEMLLPTSQLDVDAHITIELVVEFAHDHPNLPAVVTNVVVVSGTPDNNRDGEGDDGRDPVTKGSDDGAGENPGNRDDDGNGDPNDDPTVLPALQTFKYISRPFVPVATDDESLTLEGQFAFEVHNNGQVDLEHLTMIDRFLDNPGVTEIVSVQVSDIESTDPNSDLVFTTLDEAFITTPQHEPFVEVDYRPPLLVGESLFFTVDVAFKLDQELQGDTPLTNSATFRALIDTNRDGDPTNDDSVIEDTTSDGTGDETGSKPVDILLADIGIAKSFVLDPDTGLGGRAYEDDTDYFVFTIRLDVENTGDHPLTDVFIYDETPATWETDVVTVTQPRVLNAPSQGSPLILMTDYDVLGGQVALTDIGTRLQPGETFAIEFEIRIDLNDPDLVFPLNDDYYNQAEVYGFIDVADETGYGDGIADLFNVSGTSGGTEEAVAVFDLSDSGTDASGTNPGEPGDTGGSNDVTPLPNPTPPQFTVTKSAAPGSVARGDNAQWSILVENTGLTPGVDIQVVDVMPIGLAFVRGSGQLDGADFPPVVSAAGSYPRGEDGAVTGLYGNTVNGTGEVLTWTISELNAGESVKITFFAQATIALTPGQTVENSAYVYDPKWPDDQTVVSNIGKGSLSITADALFDCSTVVGQVFNDLNGNGYQDSAEPGVPGQRIVALVDGTAKTIKTDSQGRYHLSCASLPDQYMGGNIILKLDERSAPSGFRMTSENPRVVRLTAGKMTKANFGMHVARVVNLSLNACAFDGGSMELTKASKEGMRTLIKTLDAGMSTLRLTYRQRDEGDSLAKRRMKLLEKLVSQGWKDHSSADYKLDVEVELVKAIGQEPLNCDAAYTAPAPIQPEPQPQPKQELKPEVVEPVTVPSTDLLIQQQQTQWQQYAQQSTMLQGYLTEWQLKYGYQSGLLTLDDQGRVQATTPDAIAILSSMAPPQYQPVAAPKPAWAGGSATYIGTVGQPAQSGFQSSNASHDDPLSDDIRAMLEASSQRQAGAAASSNR